MWNNLVKVVFIQDKSENKKTPSRELLSWQDMIVISENAIENIKTVLSSEHIFITRKEPVSSHSYATIDNCIAVLFHKMRSLSQGHVIPMTKWAIPEHCNSSWCNKSTIWYGISNASMTGVLYMFPPRWWAMCKI